VSLYHFTSEIGELREPVLISAFDSWVDAGGAATGAAAHIGRDGGPIVSFDTDALLDYRARRPILDVVDGQAKELAWQELTVKLVHAEAQHGAIDAWHARDRPALGVVGEDLVDPVQVGLDALDEFDGEVVHRRVGQRHPFGERGDRPDAAGIGLVEDVDGALAGLAASGHVRS